MKPSPRPRPPRGLCFLLGICLSLASIGLDAQTIDPGNRTWKKVSSEHYDVICPEALVTQAQYVANSLEYLLPRQQASIRPESTLRYPVILLPDSMAANGSVSAYPWRSVFYTTPGTGLAGDALGTLAVHEGRHMVQFDAQDRNLVRALRFVFGDSALAMVAPAWVYEGDAVMSETVLTGQGRGRDPGFTVQAKALLLEGKTFNYQKMLLGSAQDEVPDAYVFGYLMFSWLRSRYNMNAPEEIFRTLSWLPLRNFGTESAVRQMSGKGLQEIWEELSAELVTFWKNQVARIEATPVHPWLRNREPGFTSYHALAGCADGSAVASRYNRFSGSQIVRVRPDAPWAVVLSEGRALHSLSSSGSLVAWDELVQDRKYDRSTTRIVVLDTATGRRWHIGEHGRYINPALSPDGRQLAVVEWQADCRGRLLVLDSTSGQPLSGRPLPDGELWSELSWTADGRQLLAIANGARGTSMIRFPAGDQSLAPEILLPAGEEYLAAPVQFGDTVYYVSNWSGINTVWALEPDGSRWQVLQRPLAAGLPRISASGRELVFTDYADSRGMVVASAPIDRGTWIPRDKVLVMREEFFEPVRQAEPGHDSYRPGLVPASVYPVSDYVFELDGNRAMTWGPSSNLFGILEGPDLGLHLDIGSIAGLSDQTVSLGYGLGTGRLGLAYDLGLYRLLPDIKLGLGGGWTDAAGNPRYDGYGRLALAVPLGEESAAGYWSVTPASSIAVGTTLSGTGAFGPVQLPLTHSLAVRAGTKRWAAEARAGYGWAPLGPAGSDHWNAALGLATPGFLPADGFSLAGYIEQARDGSYAQLAPRGWTGAPRADAVKLGLDYALPLFYPDIAFGQFYYWSKTKLGIFADREWRLNDARTRTALGVDLKLIGRVFQSAQDFSFGARAAWQVETGRWHLDFLLMNSSWALN